METLYIVLTLLGVVFITMIMGVSIVPQGKKYVVQRLGKYHKTLNPGLNIIIPYIDNISFRIVTKDIVLNIPSQEVITKDNAVITTNAVAYINVVDPQKAVYGVEDYVLALATLVQTSLRSIIGEMKLDEALSSRDMIKSKLKGAISDDIADWGVVVKTVEIQDINPSLTMQKAMEEQAAAERQRRASVTTAEGQKQATILEAEGKLEASRKEAEATILLAEASANAITKVNNSIKNELPVMYLLGEKYIDALKKLAQSDNSKTLVYPADLQQAIKGLIHFSGK
ncbi:MAG TPA: SPFH/Band 7/PHB domain protein [Gammaproteobacteria bacterium]|nr:SPFH/Band 7/PHB domain protein [Gammaproteobacteria bacterium]